MVVREWLYARAGTRLAGERFTVCPDGVGLHNVGTWLQARYGNCVDVSWMPTSTGGNVLVGWVFRAPADWPFGSGDERPADVELVAVPMLEGADGEPLRPAYAHMVESYRWRSPDSGDLWPPPAMALRLRGLEGDDPRAA